MASMTNWERWIKRYVWDDERTPYLTAPGCMTRRQADYEIFAYCVFLCCLFMIVAMTTTGLPIVATYAFSVVCVAIALGYTKHVVAAAYCATAPLSAALYLALGGLPGELGVIDHVALVAIILLWAWYGFRVVNIAKAYDAMSAS